MKKLFPEDKVMEVTREMSEAQLVKCEGDLPAIELRDRLYFWQAGGNCRYIFQYLGIQLTEEEIFVCDEEELLIQLSRLRGLEKTPELVVISISKHLCTINLSYKGQTYLEFRDLMKERGSKQLERSASLHLDNILTSCFGWGGSIEHKKKSELYGYTFRELKTYCQCFKVPSSMLEEVFTRVIETARLDPFVLRNIISKLSPAIAEVYLQKILTNVMDEIRDGAPPQKIALVIRKHLIMSGYHSVDLDEIENEVRNAVALPPSVRLGNTNWEDKGNPIIWTLRYSYVDEQISLYCVSKTKTYREERMRMTLASLMYHME